MGKAKKKTLEATGVIDRGSYFQIRFRKMVKGRKIEAKGLPRFNYPPNDPEAKRHAFEDACFHLAQVRRKLEKTVPRNVDPDTEPPTLGNWISKFEDEVLDNPKAQARKGAKQERNALKRISTLYAPDLLHIDVRDLTADHFRQMQARIPGRGKDGPKPASIRRLFYVLAAVWNHNNGKKGSLARPWEEIELPPSNDQRDRVITDKEWTRILKALQCEPQIVQDAIVFTRAMACRRSETTRLKWVHVEIGRAPKDSTVTFVDTKTPKSGQRRKRILPAFPGAFEILQRLAKAEHEEEDRVFPLHADTLTHAFRSAVENAGIKATPSLAKPVFHDLRHTRATELAKKHDALKLMQVTGHRDIRSLSRYVHSKPEDLLD